MEFSEEEGIRIVEEWGRLALPNFKGDWKVHRTNRKRSFRINWEHPEYGKKFNFFLVRVRADQTVDVVEDNRRSVIKILRSPEGLRREKRFFEVLAIRTSRTPEWFRRVKATPLRLDTRGVDGFARVYTCQGGIKLPVQVKSSEGGVRHYFEKHPSALGIVSIVCVDDSASDDELRESLYESLAKTRELIETGYYTIDQFKGYITSFIYEPR